MTVAGNSKPKMDPSGFYSFLPLSPQDLVDARTPTEKLFVLAHFGIPILSGADWRLEIGGRVERPLTLTFEEIKRFPKRRIASVHECAGSPLDPTSPKRRISNVEWAGVDLRDVIEEARVRADAEYMWSYAPDYGEFGGYRQDYYLKDLPLSRIVEGDVILAYELNGAPLPHKHGFPVRLFVAGHYGTNCVKWITKIDFAASRADSVFTTKLYTDPIEAPDGKVKERRPVWAIAPESIIVSPASESQIVSSHHDVWGWAWSAAGVRSVDLSFDGGQTWRSAELDGRTQWEWQKFRFDWRPDGNGTFEIMSRATDNAGTSQPMDGARNAMHMVLVTVP